MVEDEHPEGCNCAVCDSYDMRSEEHKKADELGIPWVPPKPVEPTALYPDAKPKAPGALCHDCTLYLEDFVPSDGPKNASVVVLAEAPGAEETRQGRPLVGQSGKLLDPVLRHHGLYRKNLLVTNTVLCRPPENRNPSKLELACCRPRLLNELSQCDTIIAFGAFATGAVMESKDGITKLRVGPPKSTHIEGRDVQVIPTWHPAYVLRVPGAFPALVADVGKIKVTERPAWVEPKYRVFTEPRQAAQALVQLQKYPKVVLDIETGLDKDEEFDHANQLICVGFSYAPGKAIVIADSALVPGSPARTEWGRLMRSARKTAHNGKFDLPGTVPTIGFLPILDEDTLLSSYAQDERGGIHGLKYRAQEEVGYPNWDIAIHKMSGAELAKPEVREKVYKYNAVDCCATWDLEELDAGRMNDTQKSVYRHLIRVSNAFMKMEMDGIKVDEPYLIQLKAKLESELGQAETSLSRWVENPRSHVQVKQALKDLGWGPKNTQAGTLEAMLELTIVSAEAKHFINQLLEYKKSFKTYSTYVEGARKRMVNGRIYPTYLLHGTVTGRPSCRNPNLQNLTRGSEVRNLYIAEEGNLFVAADYKAIELRVEACLARDQHLADLFNSGADVHTVFAREVFGEEWYREYLTIPALKAKRDSFMPGSIDYIAINTQIEVIDEKRSIAKTFVYAATYGEEPRSTANRLGIPLKLAEQIGYKLRAFMPGVTAYQADIKRRVLGGEDLMTHFGRVQHNYLITDQNRKDIVKQSWAFVPQSTANDICFNSLCRLSEAGLTIRTTTYDSIMVECPAGEAKEVGEFMRDTMEHTAVDVYSDFVLFPVDVKIGRSWGSV